MKRVSGERRQYLIRRQRRMEKHRIRRKYKERSIVFVSQKAPSIDSQPKIRRRFLRTYYQSRAYDGPPLRIMVAEELGLEADILGFLDFAENIIESNACNLFLDLENSKFIWPSAVTLLCSLMQWFELTKSSDSKFPEI
jgi:hypothetical protein